MLAHILIQVTCVVHTHTQFKMVSKQPYENLYKAFMCFSMAFLQKDVLKIFALFIRKQLVGAFFKKIAGLTVSRPQGEFLRTATFMEHLQWVLLGLKEYDY